MSGNIDTLLVVENWARDRRDKYRTRLDGKILHGEHALSGALLMQWFEEDFTALETELQKLRIELGQPA